MRRKGSEIRLTEAQKVGVTRHEGLVKSEVRRLGPLTDADRDDAIQEAWCAVCRAAEMYTPARGEWGGFAAISIRNRLSVWKRNRLRYGFTHLRDRPEFHDRRTTAPAPVSLDRSPTLEPPSAAPDHTRAVEDREAAGVAMNAIATLPGRTRLILEGHFRDGLSVDAAVRRAGGNTAAGYRRVRAGLEVLRASIEGRERVHIPPVPARAN